MSIVLSLLSRLPLSVLYGLSKGIYLLVFYVLRYRRDVVFCNLRASFPEKSEAQIKIMGKAFYRNYSDVAVEMIASLKMDERELANRVEIDGLDSVIQVLDSGTPVLLLGAHQCNMILMWLALSLKLPYPLEAVYRPVSNRAVEDYLCAAYVRFGATMLKDRSVIREIAKRRHLTRVIALTADQGPNVNDKIYWTEFLHQETGFFLAPESIARFTAYPVFFAGMTRKSKGHYKVCINPVATPPYARDGDNVIRAYIGQVEKQIIANPVDWLWMHRRWKRKRLVQVGV